MSSPIPALCMLMVLVVSVTAQAEDDAVFFYEPMDYGSQALFNPMSSFLSYTLDSVQVKRSFGTDNYNEHLRMVRDNLRHPRNRIDDEGGTKRFINSEIFPVDPDNISDSSAILPNYGLHLFGGGMIYRKNAEWFQQHDVPWPYFTSGVLSMMTEVLAEAIEKPATDSTDEIADFYLFRPLGIWLYSSDKRARWIKEELDPVEWPHLMMYDAVENELLNVGMNYVVRPRWLATKDTRLFAYMGITNLFGLSHRMDSGDELSWGAGVSTVSINPNKVRASAGVFYDRNNSLLASVIVRGTEGLAVRANIYPGALFTETRKLPFPLGVFVGVTDDGEPAVGLQFGLPIGLGATF